jgi:exodeoxyribonuclease-3
MLDSFSLHDSFRLFSPDEQVFTWWSYRAGARGKNLGWRIDYILCGDAVRSALTGSTILTNIIGSDHCPIEISFNLN